MALGNEKYHVYQQLVQYHTEEFHDLRKQTNPVSHLFNIFPSANGRQLLMCPSFL